MNDPTRVELWRTVELDLQGGRPYVDAPLEITVDAVFSHESGVELTRPAFWDGGSTWRVRFAPTLLGRWEMSVTDPAVETTTALIDAVPYVGPHEIYRRGFLRASASGRFFEFADGTPFFYLGDTHWVLPHERSGSSNAPGVPSQFEYIVDKRVAQGFTVYQSEPIWQPHREWAPVHERDDEMPVANLSEGFGEKDLPGFAQLDRKFAYIADSGLVHANAQITWAKDPAEHPEVYTAEYLSWLGRYWVARYGSYPVIWTIAQEIDKDMYGAYTADTIGLWHAVGQAIADTDAYGQVIMPHMENTSETRVATSSWKDQPWHGAFGAQIQDWEVAVGKEFWDELPAKPTVVYETRYENFWASSRQALSAGYFAYQLGMCGYGYGVAGVWNDVYSLPEEDADFGTDYELPRRYQWWFDGVGRETGDQLTHLRSFYEDREWWRFEPRFDDSDWAKLADGALLSSEGDARFTLLVSGAAADAGVSPGVVRRLRAGTTYRVSWFDPRRGLHTAHGEIVGDADDWVVPAPPTAEDWILTVDGPDAPEPGGLPGR